MDDLESIISRAMQALAELEAAERAVTVPRSVGNSTLSPVAGMPRMAGSVG